LKKITIQWPDKTESYAYEGDDWISVANKAGICIPTGCLGGSCGACEIEVNGRILRACINTITSNDGLTLEVKFSEDPYW
tara:strand:- start:877 stop:1116 length:240 start_codon:yes stop_codon:yes gene_type:complete